MYSRALQVLYDEHDIILKAIERVETLLEQEVSSSHAETLQWFITFFREYGDLYHHHKEEDILFALLSQNNPMLGESLIQALREHHEMFRENLRDAENALAENDWTAAREIFREYLSNLSDHISAENDQLFITADELLDESKKESLYFSFLDKDQELGEARKKEYEAKILNETW